MNKLRSIVVSLLAMIAPITMSAQALSSANPVQTGFTDFVTSSFINFYTTIMISKIICIT